MLINWQKINIKTEYIALPHLDSYKNKIWNEKLNEQLSQNNYSDQTQTRVSSAKQKIYLE